MASAEKGAAALDASRRRRADGEARTHHQIAVDTLKRYKSMFANVQPVGALGALWCYDMQTGLYRAVEVEEIAAYVGSTFNEKRCMTAPQYRQIAGHVLAVARRPDFFHSAPAGIAAGDRFYRITERGEIAAEPLGPELRQRWRVLVEPYIEVPAPAFTKLLTHAFPLIGSDPETDPNVPQRALLQEHIGGAITGMLARLQKVALWLGKTEAGKTTMQNVVKAFFPPSAVSSVPPHRWSHEYHAAALAGKRLNLVGEVDDKQPLGVSFKDITGGGIIGARHPTHRPFEFVPEASHIFNSNAYPATEDRSPAFWRRWSIVRFDRTVDATQRDETLGRTVIERELPYVLAWALQGAARLAVNRRLTASPVHDAALAKWQRAADSALSFLFDEAAVRLLRDEPQRPSPDPLSWRVRPRALYKAYRAWCLDNGRRPMSAENFRVARDESAAALGLDQKRIAGTDWVYGLRLVDSSED